MAHEINMRVVADEVETAEQLEFLRINGCDIAQGYFSVVHFQYQSYKHGLTKEKKRCLQRQFNNVITE
ncbi:EAL domain-containing protein [Solimicrobium silvestre]|uniref:EAL domain-containing protein n=1 Tax=Solimicrobium silvestre TaxID=2099400 RepID=UPI000CFAC00D